MRRNFIFKKYKDESERNKSIRKSNEVEFKVEWKP